MFSTILTSLALASTALLQSDISDALSAEIETMRAAYGVSGLAVSVVREDTVVLAQGFGAFESGTVTAQSQCGLYSSTKAFTAFTLASLIEDGQVDLDTPLGELLSDSPDAWRDIPLWRLYNHTSGLPMIINQEAFGPLFENPEAGNEAIYEIVRSQPLDYEPGSRWRYQQSGYAVAEMIAQERLGQTWPALVEDHLTGPAQATHTVHALLADGSKTLPMLTSAGFFRTTASDMARIFQTLNANQVVDRGFLHDLLTNPRYLYDEHGLGVDLKRVNGEMTVGHPGGGGRANLRYAPQSGVGVMACTDQIENRALTVHVADMVMEALLTGEPPRPHIASLLYGSDDPSAQDLVELLEREWRDPETHYSFEGAEGLINSLGYDRLEEAPGEAQTFFALNARLYPDSANVWDSLADAQLALGEDAAALESMRRALSLQPENSYFQSRVAEHAPDEG